MSRRQSRPRSRLIFAAITAALSVVAVSVTVALVQAQEHAEEAAALKPCTDKAAPSNFTVYSAGKELRGESLAATLRRCDELYPGEPVRGNYVSYIYGTCEIPPAKEGRPDDRGCAPPYEVQSWPACERSQSDYQFEGKPLAREDLGQLRGVPAAAFEGGTRVELYAGATTIVVFGNDPDRLAAVTDALRAEPEDAAPSDGPSAPNRGVDFEDPVPGALDGSLGCDEVGA